MPPRLGKRNKPDGSGGPCDSHHMARGPISPQLGRKRINVAARGPGHWDLERVRSVFGLLHNPWPALQMDLGISGWGGGKATCRNSAERVAPLACSVPVQGRLLLVPENQVKPQVESVFAPRHSSRGTWTTSCPSSPGLAGGRNPRRSSAPAPSWR